MEKAVAHINNVTKGAKPSVGVICGSGLSGLVNCLENKIVIKYEDIPGFPSTTVAGHTGELVFGQVGKVDVVCMKGRFHSYEGHDMKVVTLPVVLMRHIGVDTVIVTNAAGGLNRSFQVGDIMIIDDHIGIPMLAGKHPLVGPHDDTFGGARFIATSDAYDSALRELVWQTAQELGFGGFMRRTGTYAFVSGPTYESSGESNMLKKMGADAVGMSTIPEVCMARHCGMKVLGLSMITNKAILPGDTGAVATHEEVLGTVASRSKQILDLVQAVICKLDSETWTRIEPQLTKSADAFKITQHANAGGQGLKERVLSLDLNNMTPMQALTELQNLKNLAKTS